jgi:hypothetical protein
MRKTSAVRSLRTTYRDIVPWGAIESAESIAGMVGSQNLDPSFASVAHPYKERSVITIFTVPCCNPGLFITTGDGDARNLTRISLV